MQALLAGSLGQRFLWCLARVEWLSSESFLSCQVAPFLVFFFLTKQREQAFIGDFLVYTLGRVWVASLVAYDSPDT